MQGNSYFLYITEVLNTVNNQNLTIPEQRNIFKKGYSFSSIPFNNQLEIWDTIWKESQNPQAQNQAYFFLEMHVSAKEKIEQIYETAVTWQENVNCWSHCDGLSKIYTKALEIFPGKVYNQLTVWNKSQNLWHRRQSVVSLLYFSRTKKVYLDFEQIIAIIHPLLLDNEYYVQKGVGWALKELSVVYPKETFQYLKQHIKNIKPIAYTIALEKWELEEKVQLKKLRK